MTSVLLGTENPQKKEAIREAFRYYFGDELKVDMVSVDSEVPKQPRDSEIIRGAENRIRNMHMLETSKKCDYLVSVEAGIVQMGKRYYNLQYVLIEDTKTGKKSTGISQMFEVPGKYVNFALKSSINNVFRTLFGGDRVDGVSILTRGAAERGSMIREGAVMALAGQLNGDIW